MPIKGYSGHRAAVGQQGSSKAGAPHKVEPRKPRAKRMARLERQEQIRDCAISIFAKQGIAHANHTEVAEASGVSLATLFYHFPDHASLTKSVLAKVSNFLIDTIGHSAIEEGPGGLDAIERILLRLTKAIETNRELVAIWLDWSTARSSDSWSDYLTFNHDACQLVEPLILSAKDNGQADNAIDTATAARVVVGMAHMVAQMSLTSLPYPEIETAVRRLTKGYFRSC